MSNHEPLVVVFRNGARTLPCLFLKPINMVADLCFREDRSDPNSRDYSFSCLVTSFLLFTPRFHSFVGESQNIPRSSSNFFSRSEESKLFVNMNSLETAEKTGYLTDATEKRKPKRKIDICSLQCPSMVCQGQHSHRSWIMSGTAENCSIPYRQPVNEMSICRIIMRRMLRLHCKLVRNISKAIPQWCFETAKSQQNVQYFDPGHCQGAKQKARK